MQETRRKITATLVLVSLFISGNLIPQNVIQAQAATTAKKSIKVTVDQKHSKKCVSLTTVPKEMKYTSDAAFKKDFQKYGIQIKIQILSLKGKPKRRVTLFDSRSSAGSGSLLYEFSPNQYKKGTIYQESKKTAIHGGSTDINIGLPKGVKKVTYKITFSNISGKRTLKSVKVKNGFRYW